MSQELTQELTVLGICGSPRVGNSHYLLEEALQAAAAACPSGMRVLRWSVRGKKLAPCLSCFRCGELAGECVIQDGFQEGRDLWLEADVVLYSVPVYHMGLPGQLKCFIDRLGNSLFARYRSLFPPGVDSLPRQLKVVGAIAQGVHLCSGQEHTLTDLINHALLMQCLPVTGDMWEAYIGAAGWTTNDIDRAALVRQLEAGVDSARLLVKAARDVGRRAVETALLVRAGTLACRERLAADPVYRPLLERVDRAVARTEESAG